MYCISLFIKVICTCVADVRHRERDDLLSIGRVGQNFLIPGHRCIKNDFTNGNPGGTERLPVKLCAVRKRKYCVSTQC